MRAARYGAAGLVVAVLLGGCGVDAPLATGPGATPTSTRPAQSGAGAKSDPTYPACTTSDLIPVGVQQIAVGSTMYLQIAVGVNGDIACSIEGYPGIALRGGADGGTALPEEPVRAKVNGTLPMGVPPAQYLLSPGGVENVAFYLAVSEQGASGGCHAATGFEFAAPGSHLWSADVTFASQAKGPGGGASSITACGVSMAESGLQPPRLPDLTG